MKTKNIFQQVFQKPWRGFLSILPIMTLSLITACNDANFSGGAASAQRGKKKPFGDGSGSTNRPAVPITPGMEFSGDKKIEPIQNTKIWTSTTSGIIKRITIDGDKLVEEKKWSGGGGTFGMRTYVTEGGFIGARSPMLYFIDPANDKSFAKTLNLSNLDGSIVNLPIYKISAANPARICVASYLKNGQRFMVAAYGVGKWVEYPMDDKPPYAPKWEGAPSNQGQITGSGFWGYSCFIDQQQKVFYSQWVNSGNLGAVDLNRYTTAVVSDTAKNSDFKSTTNGVSQFTKGKVATSYAVSGDSYGNVYNGEGYTSSFDKSSDSVWFSDRDQRKITVIDRKCLTTEPTCTNWASYSTTADGAAMPAIGPMSALKDGRIVGLVREGMGDIYLMRLRDKTNLRSGLEVVNIGAAGGDPYMYTDFTGATLYISESEQTFKPSDMAKYAPSKQIKAAVFKWVPTVSAAAGSLSVPWKNIKLEARCYKSPGAKPAYQEITTVHPSDKGTELAAASCLDGKYDYVDIKLTQLNNDSTLVGIDTISVHFKQ